MDDPETWASISGIDRVREPKFQDGRLIGFAFDTNVAGRAYAGIATPASRVEGESISWRIQNSEIKGVVGVELTPVDQKTEIGVALHVESNGMMSRMFFPVIANVVGNGLPKTVDEFAARFDSR